MPTTPPGFYSSWAQYTITLSSRKQRDQLQSYLKERGIPSMVYYPKPLHLQKAFEYLGYNSGDFPVSEMLSNCVLSLPMHPYMSEEDILRVCSEIERFFGK